MTHRYDPPAWEGPYHQNERDELASLGCLALVLASVIVLSVLVVIMLSTLGAVGCSTV